MNKNIIVLALILILIATLGLSEIFAELTTENVKNTTAEIDKMQSSHYEKGLTYYYQGDYNQAIEELKKSSETEGEDQATTGSLLRELCRETNRIAELVQFYQSLLERLSVRKNYYNSLGVIYLGEYHDPVEAKKYFKMGMETFPEDFNTYYNYAILLSQNDDPKGAITYYKKCLEIKPDFFDAHINLGLLYGDLEMNEEATTHFKEAQRILPSHPYSYNHLGGIYRKLGRYDEAIEQYKNAIQVSSDFSDAYVNLADVYEKQGMLDEALAECKKAVEAGPQNPYAYIHIASIYEKKQMYEQAIVECQKIISFAPENFDAYSHLGYCYTKLEKWDSANAAYKKAVELNPLNANAQQSLVYVQEKAFSLEESNKGEVVELRYDEEKGEINFSSPEELFEAYKLAAKRTDKKGYLNCVTTDSKQMLLKRRFSPDSMRREYNSIANKKYRIEINADRATLYFIPEDKFAPPYMFIKENGEWKIDLKTMGEKIYFDQYNQWYIKE